MKIATKKPKAKKTAPKIDTQKYNDYMKIPPIDFGGKATGWVKQNFFMAEDEFKHLNPRLVHTEIIGWGPFDGKEYRNAISVEIYITDGIRTIDKEKEITIPIAYSYFVRHYTETWKPYSLARCFEIINGIRLREIKETREEIAADKRWEEREAREAAKKKGSKA